MTSAARSLYAGYRFPGEVISHAVWLYFRFPLSLRMVEEMTDGHDSYPRAIRTTLGKRVRHRCSRYLNNRLEQDHRGIKGRYRPMRGFKCPRSASRFCRAYDELRNFLRLRSHHHQHVPADCRRLLHLRRTATVLAIMEAA